jgi:PadR family transcriptional regulator
MLHDQIYRPVRRIPILIDNLDRLSGAAGYRRPELCYHTAKKIVPIDILVVYSYSHRISSGERNLGQQKKTTDVDMLKGTLDMLILRTLVMGPAHGHTIAHVIEHTSENVLDVEQGSLYPALHRLEDRGWVSSYWGASENNRKAKFYQLTAAGRKQLVTEASRWRQIVEAIGRVMGESLD